MKLDLGAELRICGISRAFVSVDRIPPADKPLTRFKIACRGSQSQRLTVGVDWLSMFHAPGRVTALQVPLGKLLNPLSVKASVSAGL